jgi:molybdopterin converting factor small subunit
MRVTVSFMGPFRDQLGSASMEVELPEGASYRDLLDRIGDTMQAGLPAWAWDPTKRSFARQVMVSRNLSADLRDEATGLSDGDELIVVTPLAGG